MKALLNRVSWTPVRIVGGLGCLDAAAFHGLGLAAGLVGVGLSLLALDYLADDQEAQK